MQDAARAHWLAFDNANASDMERDDFGFNNDYATAMENGDILVLSGYHILPNAGGWNDQYEADAQDLITYLRGLAWARSLKGNEDDQGNPEVADLQDFTADGAENIVRANHWQALL